MLTHRFAWIACSNKVKTKGLACDGALHIYNVQPVRFTRHSATFSWVAIHSTVYILGLEPQQGCNKAACSPAVVRLLALLVCFEYGPRCITSGAQKSFSNVRSSGSSDKRVAHTMALIPMQAQVSVLKGRVLQSCLSGCLFHSGFHPSALSEIHLSPCNWWWTTCIDFWAIKPVQIVLHATAPGIKGRQWDSGRIWLLSQTEFSWFIFVKETL